ncbi:MAG: hypothetical protein ACK4WK_10760, partial [Anaerolineae bacterium]
MVLLRDFAGRAVRLTDERRVHILEHPEMDGEEYRIGETLSRPDSVVQSYRDPNVWLYHKFYE